MLKKLNFKVLFIVPVFLGIIGGFLLPSDFVFAQPSGDYLGLAPINASGLQKQDIRITIAKIIRVLLGFLGTLALLVFLYGGFIYMNSQGDSEKINQAKGIIRNALIGLAIIISAYGITSFILNALNNSAGGEQSGANIWGPGGAFGSTGRNAIESHYPPPDAKNIPRNTKIIVTFREKIKLNSLVNKGPDKQFGTADDYITSNVQITQLDGEPLAVTQVLARFTEDQKTFVFDPIPLLGNPISNTMYKVTLANNIKNINNEKVFGGVGFYDWQFEVGTFVDLTPPQVRFVMPEKVSVGENPKQYDRNIVVHITFNEAVDPTSATGVVSLGEGGDTVLNGFKNIQIYSLDDNNIKHFVKGTFSTSNLYRTVEFLTDDACGVNSCGQTIFCLPGLKTLNVDILAATLINPESPESDFPYDGVVDIVGNSLDGDYDGVAQGPPVDDFSWVFKTTDKIDLEEPYISQVVPARYVTQVPLNSKVDALFSKFLMYKTLNKNNIKINDVFYWLEAYPESATILVSGKPVQRTVSRAFIEHRSLADDWVYTPEMRSGILDIYQNCFYPCNGPQVNLADSRAQDDAKRVDLTLIKNAIDEYYRNNGTYFLPGAFNGGQGLVTAGNSNSIFNKLVELTSLSGNVDEITYSSPDSGYQFFVCSDNRTYSLSATFNFPPKDCEGSLDPQCVGPPLAHIKGVCNSPEIVSIGKNVAVSNFNTLTAYDEFTRRDEMRKSDISLLKKTIDQIGVQNNGDLPGDEGKCYYPADIISGFAYKDPVLPWKVGFKNYLYINFGSSYALLSQLEFNQDRDYQSREVKNFEYQAGKTLSCDKAYWGIYHYCQGDCSVVPVYKSGSDRVLGNMSVIKNAIDLLVKDTNQYPGHSVTSGACVDLTASPVVLTDCSAGLSCNDGGFGNNWHGPYMNLAGLTDPWGQPYVLDFNYEYNQVFKQGNIAKIGRVIRSFGPDKQNRTGDDLYQILCAQVK